MPDVKNDLRCAEMITHFQPKSEKLSKRTTKFRAKTVTRDCNTDWSWSAGDTTKSLKQFWPPSEPPGMINTDNSLDVFVLAKN